MTSIGPVIRNASGRADIEIARTLFLEYSKWLEIDLCFQGFNEELATLPGAYAPPSGRLLLADAYAGGAASTVLSTATAPTSSTTAAGCVALRRLSIDPTGASCELKRLWVRPEFRGRNLGHALTDAALDEARAVGYRSIKLDTLPHIMPNAVAMYRSFGFIECAPYYHNPIQGSMYMECAL